MQRLLNRFSNPSLQDFDMSNHHSIPIIAFIAGIWLLISSMGFAAAQTEPLQNSVPVMLKITDYPGAWPESVPVPIGLINMGGSKFKTSKRDDLVLYQTFFPDLSESTSETPGKDYILLYATRLKQAGFNQTRNDNKSGVLNLSFERDKYKINIAYGVINTPTSKESIEVSFEFPKSSPR